MPVATFELPPPGAIRALMGARLTNRGVPNPPKIAHHPTGFEESLQIREIWMRLVKTWCLAMPAVLALAGSALGAPDPGASVAWPSGTAVVSYESEQALAAALERHPAQIVRRIPALDVAVVRPRGNVERYAREDRRGAGNPPRRAGGGSTVARRARPCLARPRGAVPVAVRGRAGRSGPRGGGAGGGGLHDRRDRHRRRPRRAGSRREGAAHLQRPQAAGRTSPTATATAPSSRLSPPARRRTGTGSPASAARQA